MTTTACSWKFIIVPYYKHTVVTHEIDVIITYYSVQSAKGKRMNEFFSSGILDLRMCTGV